MYTFCKFQKKANKKKVMQTRASSDGPSGTNVPSPSSGSAPGSAMATPQQQPHYVKRRTSESNETTPTPLSSSEKLTTIPPNHHKHPAATGPSCPLTPVTATTSTTGKMLNGGGHLPSQQNHHPSGKSGGGSSNGKGNGRGAKRRRPSQATETPPHQVAAVHPGPVVGPQALFSPSTSATSTPNHIPAVTMVPNFVTPVITPISSVTPPPSGGHMTDLKRIEGDSVCSVSPLPVFSTVAPVQLMTTTASQSPMALNHKHTPAAASSKSSATIRGGVTSSLNGSVCDVGSGTMSLGKNDRTGKGHHNDDVKVKRERSEERTGWPSMATPPVTTAAGLRDFPPPSIHGGGLKPEMAQMTRADMLNIFPPHLLQVMPAPGPPPPPAAAMIATAACTPPPPPLQQRQAIDAAASVLFCSERVPGMMSGDLKPVIQPVRPIRHSPSPRARSNVPLKKNDVVDAFSTPPESYSSIPQHPVDSPSSMSQSATELSPSPPCSPIHPSTPSSKKLHHSSSSSSLSSSLSGSAPSSATLLMGKNGVLRPTESTIQERGEAEEARIDMDESSAPSQHSPSSSMLSDNSSSEKERSPPVVGEQQHHHSRSKGSQSPDTTGKRRRRSYETEEQFEERRKARRAKLNFMVNFGE